MLNIDPRRLTFAMLKKAALERVAELDEANRSTGNSVERTMEIRVEIRLLMEIAGLDAPKKRGQHRPHYDTD